MKMVLRFLSVLAVLTSTGTTETLSAAQALASPAARSGSRVEGVIRIPSSYVVDAVVAPGGAGAVARDPDLPSYASGTTITLTATASSGYAFAGWSGDAEGAENPIAIVADGDKSVTATFVFTGHWLEAGANTGGSISPAGHVPVVDGADQTFAIVADPHHHLVDVRVDDVSVGAQTSYTFTGVTESHTIEAEFAVDRHHLTVDVTGGGTVTRGPAQDDFDWGATVMLGAAPDSGQRFAGWSGDASGNDDPLSLVMDGDKHVTATFVDAVAPTVHLTSPNGGETVATGEVVEVRWTAADAAPGTVTTVDLLVSRNGAAGPFEPIATGLPNDSSYVWTVDGPTSGQVMFEVVAHDDDGNAGADLSDGVASIVVNPVTPIVWLRADSASASGPPIVPGNGGPWHDVTGHQHDGQLWNYTGTPSSGWRGDGTTANPYRLEFAGEEAGVNDRVIIPGGTVPELQTLGATTSAVWFKTGFSGAADRYEYVLEWVQEPAVPYDPVFEGRGMSIIVHDGMLKVYANPWIDVTPVTPNTWYHVAVVKDTNDMRIYVNGEKRFAGTISHRGIQQSEIVLGASTFREFEGQPFPIYFSDWFTGAIAQLYIGQGAMTDGQVRGLYEADRGLFPALPIPPLERVVLMRANVAAGSGPYTTNAGGTWSDRAVPATDGVLAGFDGTNASGWQGEGTPDSPYRLHFDGVDDHVIIPARGVTELQNLCAATADVWVKPGAEILGPDFKYLLEWLQGQGSSAGMSIAMANGRLQIFTATPWWSDVAAITPGEWHHIVVAKQPGEIRVYLDGARVFTGVHPHLGDQTSEVVLGASTWRGPQVYGDFFTGDVGSFSLWRGAMQDADVAIAYATDKRYAFGTTGGRPRRYEPELSLSTPNADLMLGRLTVSLTLPTSAPASIEMIDVAGRRLRSRDLGALGAGRHRIDLGGVSEFHAGVYFLRLRQGAATVTAKATVLP